MTAASPVAPTAPLLADRPVGEVLALARDAEAAAREHLRAVARVVRPLDGPDTQFLRHGFAWLATVTEVLTAVGGWARRLDDAGDLDELERLLFLATVSETLQQICFGVTMSQGEVARPHHFGLDEAARSFASSPAVAAFLGCGTDRLGRQIVDEAVRRGSFGRQGLDETLTMIADEFRTFVDARVAPHAQSWHQTDALIPDALIAELADLGVFGLTIAQEHGGSGLGKLAMCVVTEELSRGYLGIGSLGTRAEIAGELLQRGASAQQMQTFLPRIASGAIYPCAVFTEPDVGSDLAHLRTRAVRGADGRWRLSGAKTWITHAARSDLMTVLARTDPGEPGHRGLSMFLLEKTRGTAQNPFPDAGIAGEEIEVLGYRGMKEYTLFFDEVVLPEDAVLGGAEGRGFRQLMATFESARIQTAARAVGVAVNACELALTYAAQRRQFGREIGAFQRVYGKIARMLVDITAARQLTYAAARAKDDGHRCDIEAGMAKLLGAQAAWANADNALQIHGGNGYSTEYAISRVLCDARILNIFEGAAEIQAEVIARGLLQRRGNEA